jgi:cytochrome b6-f complex iron-sulfur subunit
MNDNRQLCFRKSLDVAATTAELSHRATVAVTATAAMYPAAPVSDAPKEAGEDGSIIAKDQLGNFIPASQILAEPPGTRALVAGLAENPPI